MNNTQRALLAVGLAVVAIALAFVVLPKRDSARSEFPLDKAKLLRVVPSPQEPRAFEMVSTTGEVLLFFIDLRVSSSTAQFHLNACPTMGDSSSVAVPIGSAFESRFLQALRGCQDSRIPSAAGQTAKTVIDDWLLSRRSKPPAGSFLFSDARDREASIAEGWSAYCSAVRSGYKQIAAAQQMERLFHDVDHMISYPSDGPFIGMDTCHWHTRAYIGNQYYLDMIVQVKATERKYDIGSTVLAINGQPIFVLYSVSGIVGTGSGVTPKQWDQFVESNGDLRFLGIQSEATLPLNQPAFLAMHRKNYVYVNVDVSKETDLP